MVLDFCFSEIAGANSSARVTRTSISNSECATVSNSIYHSCTNHSILVGIPNLHLHLVLWTASHFGVFWSTFQHSLRVFFVLMSLESRESSSQRHNWRVVRMPCTEFSTSRLYVSRMRLCAPTVHHSSSLVTRPAFTIIPRGVTVCGPRFQYLFQAAPSPFGHCL